MIYARVTKWLSVPRIERRIALMVFLCTLPSLAMGLEADDYFLAAQVREGGPFAGYVFIPRDPPAARAWLLEGRSVGRIPWWADEHPHGSFFRPLSSLSLWLDFAHGAPAWWMHLESCAIYALTVWLALALYAQLGLSGAGLGWAALFLGLDGAFSISVGWIAARNTLLAACFGFACILLHDRARRAGRPVLLALACLCFSLSLLSAELGLCTLGYVCAHALAVDRGSPLRRALALVPYAALTLAYLVYYVTAGYGFRFGGAAYRDVFSSPGSVLLAYLESIPLWFATTATLPLASFQLMLPNLRVPLLVGSVVVLALLLPLLWARRTQQPQGRMFALGALLSIVPLATVLPQERLRFFLAFGVYGLLGPWVARDFDAGERVRRWVARFLWGVHGIWLPVLFVPSMFGISASNIGRAARALDEALPRTATPTAIVLNPPTWIVPGFQAAMRAYTGEMGPPVLALYAGGQSIDIQRVDDRSLELHAARSWFATPFEHLGGIPQAPFRAGDRVVLPHFTVEVRELDAAGVPTRARFTFERSLDDPGLSFRYWKGYEVAVWTPPPPGGSLQLPAAAVF